MEINRKRKGVGRNAQSYYALEDKGKEVAQFPYPAKNKTGRMAALKKAEDEKAKMDKSRHGAAKTPIRK